MQKLIMHFIIHQFHKRADTEAISYEEDDDEEMEDDQEGNENENESDESAKPKAAKKDEKSS